MLHPIDDNKGIEKLRLEIKMEKESLQVYTARITQANRSELVVIMYELILDTIEEGKNCFASGDVELYNSRLQKVIKIVNELISTLDFKYVLSLDLLQLYLYINQRIIEARIKKDPELLESGVKVIDLLLKGFEGVAKEDASGPVMKNTQQLYAGLTYGKGTLNETSIEPGMQSRGFQA